MGKRAGISHNSFDESSVDVSAFSEAASFVFEVRGVKNWSSVGAFVSARTSGTDESAFPEHMLRD